MELCPKGYIDIDIDRLDIDIDMIEFFLAKNQ